MSLGAPIRKPDGVSREWVAVPGSPGIERNTRTGRLRTNIAPPPAQPVPWTPPKGWPRARVAGA